jgi:hypothetical protein
MCGDAPGLISTAYVILPWSHDALFGTIPFGRGVPTLFHPDIRLAWSPTSAKNISVPAEWLPQSGRAPSEPSETPRWRMTHRPASIPRIALHITLRSLFRHFFSLCRCLILNKHSGVVANCDHMSEWVHWVHPCIGIAMRWVKLQKSLLTLRLH